MLIIIGILAGLTISLIGSFLISVIPWISFAEVFSSSIIPSILVLIFLTLRTKPNGSKFKHWLNGFLSLFVIGFFALLIRNFFQWKAVAHMEGSGLIWDAVILFNLLYSLGGALLISPLGYFAIKRIAHLKKQFL